MDERFDDKADLTPDDLKLLAESTAQALADVSGDNDAGRRAASIAIIEAFRKGTRDRNLLAEIGARAVRAAS